MSDIWTDARIQDFSVHWADGLSCSQIAAELGCFEDYADKGRSAVMGQAKRLRDRAKKEGREGEAKFWSRAKLKGKGLSRSSKKRAKDKPLTRHEKERLLASVKVIPVSWPSDAEVTAAAAASISAVATGLGRK